MNWNQSRLTAPYPGDPDLMPESRLDMPPGLACLDLGFPPLLPNNAYCPASEGSAAHRPREFAVSHDASKSWCPILHDFRRGC